MNKTTNLNMMVKGALLVSLSFALSYVEIPVIPSAPWLQLDFSAVPLLFAALAFGVSFGIGSTAMLQLLIYFIKGSKTGGVGEIANFIMVGSFIMVFSLVYRYIKGNRSLIIGSALGTLALILAGVLSNKFILIPLFFPKGFNGGPTALNAYLYKAVPLFNLIKGLAVSFVGVLGYSKIGFLIKKEHQLISAEAKVNKAL